MIGYLIDRFKNSKKRSSDNESKNDIVEQKIDKIATEQPEEFQDNDKQAELLEEKPKSKIKKKKKKTKIWLKKRKKPKHRGFTFFIGLFFLMGFLISRLMVLYSNEEYILIAKLRYTHSIKSYEIIYEIEDMDNSFNININEKVCTPYYFTSNDTAVRKSSDLCLKGKIISSYKDRVNVKYENLPKYLTLDDLSMYLDKTKIHSNTTISKVNIKMKYFMGRYQILSIYPRNNE